MLVASGDARSERTEDEEANHFEVPAEWLLRELIREKSPACRLSVVRSLLDAAQHLSNGATLGVEHSLPPLITQKSKLPEDRRQALQVLRREQSFTTLLGHCSARGRFLEAVEDFRKNFP